MRAASGRAVSVRCAVFMMAVTSLPFLDCEVATLRPLPRGSARVGPASADRTGTARGRLPRCPSAESQIRTTCTLLSGGREFLDRRLTVTPSALELIRFVSGRHRRAPFRLRKCFPALARDSTRGFRCSWMSFRWALTPADHSQAGGNRDHGPLLGLLPESEAGLVSCGRRAQPGTIAGVIEKAGAPLGREDRGRHPGPRPPRRPGSR